MLQTMRASRRVVGVQGADAFLVVQFRHLGASATIFPGQSDATLVRQAGKLSISVESLDHPFQAISPAHARHARARAYRPAGQAMGIYDQTLNSLIERPEVGAAGLQLGYRGRRQGISRSGGGMRNSATRTVPSTRICSRAS